MQLDEILLARAAAVPPARAAQPAALLELDGVEKRFGPVRALRSVSLRVRAGSVHALIGENGAGKSTLIRILTGAQRRTSGTIRIAGQEVALATPKEALGNGIFAVHQEMVLCPDLTVAENIFLGSELSRYGVSDGRQMSRRARTLLDELGFPLNAESLLRSLSIGQQQLVACARAALYGHRLIIFDEPTGYLSRAETDLLFAFIRRLRREGRTVIYISHRMEEIFELADDVSVLRDGSVISSRPVAAVTSQLLVREMAAREVGQVHYKEAVPIGAPLLEVQGLSGPGFHDVSLTVRSGEIVGIFGLVGSGRSEFARCLFGRTRRSGGRVLRDGRDMALNSVDQAIAAGIALIPESRRDEGLCLDLDIRHNMSLAALARFARRGVISAERERRAVSEMMRELRVVAESERTGLRALSGGNQQKVVIGKWLLQGARVFIFDEPTVGVDVATKAEIYRLIARLLREGAGVIVISSYLPEVHDLADTLIVFRSGTSTAAFRRGEATPDAVLAAAVGA